MKRFLCALSAVIIVFSSCAGRRGVEPLTDHGKNHAARLRELGQYINLKSEVLDTRYRLYDVNRGGRGVPGATHRDYRVWLRVGQSNLRHWKAHWVEVDPEMIEPPFWSVELIGREAADRFFRKGVRVYRPV